MTDTTSSTIADGSLSPAAGMTAEPTQPGDWASDQEVRWCPGCGDYSILTAMRMLMPSLGTQPHNTVFISGIGCAARFPYYMNTYGIHGIHGRAPAIATGLAMARPDLDIWVIGGDGDMLSIGGNHLIHALRRNIKIKLLLFNNMIYGLTKGQFSPTSEMGKVTRSSPMGSLAAPFNPLAVALGAEASFVARTHDMDRQHMMETFRRAHAHDGAAFVEVFQNCNVFNDGAFDGVTKKQNRDANLIPLTHGEPIRFGADGEFGVIDEAGYARVVLSAEVSPGDLLVHDEARHDPSTAFMLARVARGPFEPTPIGVFRAVQRSEYAMASTRQLAAAQQQNGPADIAKLLRSCGTWRV